MRDKFLDFAALLRKNGVRLSTAEVLDGLRAIELIGLDDREAIYGALRATLIKRPEDLSPFDELFELYFFRPGSFARGISGEDSPLLEALRKQGLGEDELEQVLALLASEAARLDPTARSAMGLRRGHVEALIRLAGLRVDFARLLNPLQVGFFSQQVIDQLKLQKAEESLRGVGERLRRAIGDERGQEIENLLMDNLRRLRGAVRGYVQDEFQRRNIKFMEEFRSDLLSQKPFGQLSEDELRKLRKEVERLCHKLRSQSSLRPQKKRRGRLDIRRTLRRSLSLGGVPLRLVFQRRRVERPRLVVLCDVSDSVRTVSRFMLQFAYTLQERFAKVRSFVFVSDIGETTDLFARHELHRAVDLAYAGAVINVHANSNYGNALRRFCADHLSALTSRTTVLIIGDGRNNYHPAEAWALARIRARAKTVLWLNPEPRGAWSFGDSAMREYEPHLTRAEVVNNLASLQKVIDSLLL
jgi:hypothetical protein